MLRCCCLSYTTARPPLVLLIGCIMQLLGKFSAHSLCPRLIHSLSRGLSRVGSGGLCARASSPFPSPGASDAGVQGSPGTPGSMHPCVPGPREWALLHMEPGWLHGGGEAGRREAGGRHFCLPLQTESTTSQHKSFKPPPFFFFPQNANHNLIAPKQTCISRTQAQPRGRLWPHGRQVGLPKQDGAGSVTSQALYESPESTRQGVSGDDVPRTLPAGVNAQRQRPVSPCRVTRAGGSGPS